MIATIKSLTDLKPYGFDILTGEACGLSYRLLTDLTYNAYKIYCECNGLPITISQCEATAGIQEASNGGSSALYFPPKGFPDAWNPGPSKSNPSICSVMIAPDDWIKLAVFALFNRGCCRVDIYRRWCSNQELQRELQRRQYFIKAMKELGIEQGNQHLLPYEAYENMPRPMNNGDFIVVGCTKDEDFETDEHRYLRINTDHLRVFKKSTHPGTGLRNEHQISGRTE